MGGSLQSSANEIHPQYKSVEILFVHNIFFNL